MTTVDTIPWGDVEAAAKLCAGNWQKFECFAWTGDPPNSHLYMIYNYSNRDSTLLTESNAAYIEKTLKKYQSVHFECHNHWAVGYVNAIVIKVYRKDEKTINEGFKKFCEIMAQLEEYPVLDETDYSNREYEATIENIKTVGNGAVKASAPVSWASEVYSWLSEYDDSEIQNRDDQGGYPSEESVKKALTALRMIDPAESLNKLEDFPVGSVVVVQVEDNNVKPFTAVVLAHAEDFLCNGEIVPYDNHLIVESRFGTEKFAVLPGEVRLAEDADEDDCNDEEEEKK